MLSHRVVSLNINVLISSAQRSLSPKFQCLDDWVTGQHKNTHLSFFQKTVSVYIQNYT